MSAMCSPAAPCRYGCCACLSALPTSKTCSDCVHVVRCVAIFGQQETDTACQWIPSRALIRAGKETL